MAASPISPRLIVAPWWALQAGRRAIVEWGAPLLEVRVGGRSPLPSPQQLRALAEAADVRGVWLKVERLVLEGGQATLHESVEALLAARAAGRLVIGEFDFVGNAELLLAAACDRAWVRPGTQLFCVGLGTTLRFYGDLLGRFGARFDVEAVGEFKSFGEQFGRGYASSPNRESTRVLVDELSDEWIRAIVRCRPAITEAALREAVAMAPLRAEEAVERGLIDGAKYPDEVEAEVEQIVGKEPRVVPFAAWHKAWLRARRLERFIAGHAPIPVVWLKGAVVDGSGTPGASVIAVRPVLEVLEKLREAKQIPAVVLRVSSPGGSAAASDLLWRAVERLVAEKPVVASFGDVSASGGFYLSAAATEIVCHPASITGSIGVISGKPVLRPAMERQGVHSEDILSAPHADLFAETAFSPSARARWRVGLEATYRGFVERVAKGRKRSYDEVEVHARGRVWTGRHAHAVGLVDHLGGLEVAQARAAALAGATKFRSWDIAPQPKGAWMQRLLRQFAFAAVPELRVLDGVPVSARMFTELPGEALALWPFEADIR